MKKVTDLETTIFVYDGVGKLVAEYSTATPPQNPTIATARKIVAGAIAATIHYEVNPLGIDVSDPGTQMALIEATGGLAGPMVAEEKGGSHA